MNIDSIHSGIVLDHITAGRGMKIYQLLNLDALDCSVAIIKNGHSNKMGKKDIIKIDADIELNMDILGYVAPGVTVNIIKDEKLVESTELEDLQEQQIKKFEDANPAIKWSDISDLDGLNGL